ncbi:GNAT family N-acetyltransferase [Nonomuraea sp. NBC_01738]|uniref:GNAT family N-acetyltransferase n=1 Tax=Nonomuraea sp. NBC_01738 TaxID=2976003 RepID=UPI002E117839|nr:GNAT family N-acetyltransferase [Nonomuraea sp. NBC_01738]
MRNWPIFHVTITTPRLELRLPALAELDDLADRAAEGVHEPGFMPFTFPWTDAEPAERARSTMAYHFRKWSEWTPEEWSASFAVIFEGQVVGTQELAATDFGVTGEVTTGSWIGHRFQGKGIGAEMRRAVLHLAFEGLGAVSATTEAFDDNAASLGVTRKLGYREDGLRVQARRGKAALLRRFRLGRDDWRPEDGYAISGLEPCLPLFGRAVTA